MASLDEFYAQLWTAFSPTIPRNTGSGIYKAWMENYPDWGSPLADEAKLDDGTPIQTFSSAIVKWTEQGAEVVTGAG